MTRPAPEPDAQATAPIVPVAAPHAEEPHAPDDPDDPEEPAMSDAIPDLLDAHLEQIGATPLLTAEEEVALAQRIAAGAQAQRDLAATTDPRTRLRMERQIADGADARDHLIRANLRLVVAIAKKYQGRGVALTDLIQEGSIGLMRAVEKFDHTRGHKFSTYATWWIRQAVSRAVYNDGSAIRIPVHRHEHATALNRMREELAQAYGRTPTDVEVADQLGWEVAKIHVIDAAFQIARPFSLDAPLDHDSEATLVDLLPGVGDVASAVTSELIGAQVRAALAQLPARAQQILTRRFGLDGSPPQTLEVIGAQIGLTRERVRQIQRDALDSLRTQLADLRDAVVVSEAA